MRRRAAALASIFTILLAFPLVASAHPDGPGARGRHVVGANAFLALPLRIHYHRLVGEFRVSDPPGASIALLLVDLEGAMRLVPGKREGTAFVSEGPGGKLNHLILCCAGATWSDRLLVIENRGTAAATIVLETTLIHDDLGVTVLDGEPGAVVGVLSAFAVIAALIALPLVRRLRSKAELSGRGGRLLAASAALFAVAALSASVLSVVGVVNYGGGPVAGFVASVATVPFPPGPFGSAFSIPYGVVLFFWAAGLVTWSQAVGRTQGANARRAAALGLAVGLVSLAVAILVGSTYETMLVPAAGLLLLGLPPALTGTAVLLERIPSLGLGGRARGNESAVDVRRE